jgi:hypothetical protein
MAVPPFVRFNFDSRRLLFSKCKSFAFQISVTLQNMFFILFYFCLGSVSKRDFGGDQILAEFYLN